MSIHALFQDSMWYAHLKKKFPGETTISALFLCREINKGFCCEDVNRTYRSAGFCLETIL